MTVVTAHRHHQGPHSPRPQQHYQQHHSQQHQHHHQQRHQQPYHPQQQRQQRRQEEEEEEEEEEEQEEAQQHAPAVLLPSRLPGRYPDDKFADNTAFPSLATPQPRRDNPDLSASSAPMPSRVGTDGPSVEHHSVEHKVQPLAKRATELAHRRAAGAVDSSDSDRREGEHPSRQKNLTVITSQDDGAHSRPQRPKPPLLRSKSDYAVRHDEPESTEDEAYEWGARHGFEDHYQSEDIISHLANNWYMYFTDKRHETTGQAKESSYEIEDWRMRDRLKTVSAALAVCLNIGVEPPDQLKTNPGAKLEAWQDPFTSPAPKALETIGKALQAQYENISVRTRYKQYLDPSIEDTKKFCMSLRRNAKDERVLLHYNGHGVPKPTASGEIWVFNKNFTQYIPISLYDLQQWLQAPTVFVWDCSEAGNIVNNYHRFVEKHQEEEEATAAADPNYEKAKFDSYLHLAACAVKENLPTNPLLPADLFTACLTTPIEMALWFFVLQNPLKTSLTPERAKKLPGRLQERRTPLGELNWIFTAITDSIAWTTLPRQLFRKFFRQDLMVAALFRNFILAQRIMMVYGCHPQSYPSLPDTHQHPLWESWDLAVDLALAQLPMLEQKETQGIDYEYQSSTFFAEQLTAFEVYLGRGDALVQKPPDQLPVVLQVLLSQQHRVRALILLGRFLDQGPWAVQLALSIGIFPYVLKLLQSAASELKPVMVFIWTRVLAVDISCQPDLIKDSGYNYFATILNPTEPLPVLNVEEHKAMCAFVLAMLCKNYRPGQVVCNQTEVMTYCLTHLQHDDHMLLRQWACLCISQLWQDLPDAKWRGIRENVPMKLSARLKDSYPEVRAAVVHAMTTFLGIPDLTDEVARIEESIAWTLLDMANDGSPLVRKELLVFLSNFVLRYENKFIVAAFEQLGEELEYTQHPPAADGMAHKMGLHYARPENIDENGFVKASAQGLSFNTVFAACWKHILILNVDPHPEVQRDATIIADYVHNALFASSVGPQAQALADEIHKKAQWTPGHKKQSSTSRNSAVGLPVSYVTQPEPSPGLLKRTASILFPSIWGAEERAVTSSPTPSPDHRRTIPPKPRFPADLNGAPEQSDQAYVPAHYHVADEPVSGNFAHRKFQDQPSLPLNSTFLDWSIEYFREPQMIPNEAEEPGSTEYNERLWRRSRNEAILRETQPQKQYAGSHKWNNQLCIMNNGAQPTKMTFHQFEDHLAVADDSNTVYVWDWKKQNRLHRFSNGNPEGSKISDMKFINEDDTAFLMTGSSDGVLRIYRNYESSQTIELASAWRALTDMVPSNINSGMVFDWQQVTGRVLVAGDVRVIRVWAAASETCITDIPARSGSCVTSLTSDQMTGNIFVAGFGDGAVRVFDTRLRPQDSMVKKWKDKSDMQWIRNVHMQRGGQRELLSASRNGKVKLWDIRMDNPLRVIHASSKHLRTASTHEHLPVFSVGTSAHNVKVFNFDGQELSCLEPYSSFLQHNRGAPIATTAFHPHRMILGCAARDDYHINLFTCASEKPEVILNSL
ncbi:raptor N-terminal caspase like domain-containing protein [Nemania sp. FL0916]|nr:raptor N-terminal caspase like domain-containing protein [Nemania sp. FL0916]